MDTLISLLGSILVETGRSLCSPIYPKIQCFFGFDSNIKALHEQVTSLFNLKTSIEEEIELGQRQGKRKTNQVDVWLTKVEAIKIQVTSIQEEIIANKEKLHGCFLNCSMRRRLSVGVVEKLNEVKQLQEEGVFPMGVVMMDFRVKVVEQLPGTYILGQRTASGNLGKILSLLKDVECGIIGIWGMGGVGKTTLIRNLNNELGVSKEAQLFSVVIWVTVSKDLDLRKLQNQIAERLKLEVGGSMERTATRLFDRLKQGKFLLILDDVWERIDLDKLGIPQPQLHVGCKIILTTRSREVCGEMKTDEDVKVDVLDKKEWWPLFCENAGKVVDLDHINSIAKGVARECCGLPLAIITVGRAMRGKEKVELWKHALRQLQSSDPWIKGMEKEVFLPLKWSYDLLEGKTVKSCFLYCCLYPEDFSIDVKELVKCLVADGVIDTHESLEESFNRGITLVENLKDTCLLESGTREGTVRVHDVVRDVAIWITSSHEDENKSLVRSGMGLNQISEVENWKSFRRISFMNNNIKSLPDCVVQCSDVTTLLLQGNSSLGMIPEAFFHEFQALRVLNLSSTLITMLPHSLTQLRHLRALLLSRCNKLRDLSSLQGLDRLQMLDLSNSLVRSLPQGMKGMNNLRYLNLSQTILLETIPAGTISGLSCLEVLDMRGSKYVFNGPILHELSLLECLWDLSITMDLSITIETLSPEDLNKLWVRRLTRFFLVISEIHIQYQPPFPCSERSVVICGLFDNNGFRHLLGSANGLVLHDGEGNIALWLESNAASLCSLKSLAVDNFKWVKLVHDYMKVVPALEELYLQNMFHLSDLSDFLSLVGSNLRIIKITNCEIRGDLLPFVYSDRLQNLREIEVSNCPNIINLIPDSRVRYSLPNLRIVNIKNLPNLVSICTNVTTWPCIEQIGVHSCPKLFKLPLSVRHDNQIQMIRGEFEWWDRLELNDEDSKLRLQNYFQPMESSSEMSVTPIWKDTRRPVHRRK